MQLTQEQVQKYFENGYLVLPNLIPQSLIEKIVSEIETSMADANKFAANRKHFNFATNTTDGKHYVLQALQSENLSQTLRDLIQDSKIHEIVTAIIGPNFNLFQSKLVFKKAHGGAEVPWHQDFEYWKMFSENPLQLNFGIYLDDTTKENGCLEVIPGSHQVGLKSHSNNKDLLSFPIQFNCTPNLENTEFIEGPKGTVVLFTALTAHHSGLNNSARRRLFLNMVFTPDGNERVDQPVVARLKSEINVLNEINISKISNIWGHGPHGGQCAPQYRIKEIWKQAITNWNPALKNWIYLHSNQADDSAPEWFLARRKENVNFIHLQNGNENKATDEKVQFLNGDLLAAVSSGVLFNSILGEIGLLVVQSQDYWIVKKILTNLEAKLKVGTVLVFENFFENKKWEQFAARALLEFSKEHLIELNFLSKAEKALLVEIKSREKNYTVNYAENAWKSNTQGISTGFGEVPLTKVPQTLNPLKMVKKVLKPLREDSFPSPYFRDFFPAKKIPQFKGGDVLGSCCGTHLRRKELWKYALSFVTDKSLSWCEFGVGEGESLDWFALQKPKENLLFGFDSFEGIPEAWASSPKGQWKTEIYSPNRTDVRIVPGLYDKSLNRPEVVRDLGKKLGFIHIDCDLYNSTRIVFESIKHLIGPGTILVFDEMYGYHNWHKHEAKAFFELVQEKKFEFEFLGRSDAQVAVRIISIGVRWKCFFRPIQWAPSGNGIRFNHGEDLFLGYSMSKLKIGIKVLFKRLKQRLIKP